MESKLINPQLFCLQEYVTSWEQAIELSCQQLLKYNFIKSEYIKKLIDCVNEEGPYFILLDNFALPHVKEFRAVNDSAVAFTVLKNPVMFPGAHPVQVLCTLAAKDQYAHLCLLRDLSEVLQRPKIIKKMISVANIKELQEVLEGK